jgi:hypothetical protein
MSKNRRVSLVFYKIDPQNLHKEPLLNLLAAAAQASSFCHCELSFNKVVDAMGVGDLRSTHLAIFNDNSGVELMPRRGTNPNTVYLELPVTQAQEDAMWEWSMQQRGKPFNNQTMLRSLIWPSTTDQKSYFCAELVACCLQKGGLIDPKSNPAAATPASLYRLFSKSSSTSANPFVIRRIAQGGTKLTTNFLGAAPAPRLPQPAQSSWRSPAAAAPTPTPSQRIALTGEKAVYQSPRLKLLPVAKPTRTVILDLSHLTRKE